MNRRDFAAALASVLLGTARVADAQSRVPHIVFLWLGPAGSGGDTLNGYQAGLREFGYEEGRNLIVDYRYADGSEAGWLNSLQRRLPHSRT
jgi:putative tryptophan/tyrosine transport system substrate-binding protein